MKKEKKESAKGDVKKDLGSNGMEGSRLRPVISAPFGISKTPDALRPREEVLAEKLASLRLKELENVGEMGGRVVQDFTYEEKLKEKVGDRMGGGVG